MCNSTQANTSSACVPYGNEGAILKTTNHDLNMSNILSTTFQESMMKIKQLLLGYDLDRQNLEDDNRHLEKELRIDVDLKIQSPKKIFT